MLPAACSRCVASEDQHVSTSCRLVATACMCTEATAARGTHVLGWGYILLLLQCAERAPLVKSLQSTDIRATRGPGWPDRSCLTMRQQRPRAKAAHGGHVARRACRSLPIQLAQTADEPSTSRMMPALAYSLGWRHTQWSTPCTSNHTAMHGGGQRRAVAAAGRRRGLQAPCSALPSSCKQGGIPCGDDREARRRVEARQLGPECSQLYAAPAAPPAAINWPACSGLDINLLSSTTTSEPPKPQPSPAQQAPHHPLALPKPQHYASIHEDASGRRDGVHDGAGKVRARAFKSGRVAGLLRGLLGPAAANSAIGKRSVASGSACAGIAASARLPPPGRRWRPPCTPALPALPLPLPAVSLACRNTQHLW